MAYNLTMHHDMIGRPMSKITLRLEDDDDNPSRPQGCIRDGFKVFEVYTGICSGTETSFNMMVELRIRRRLSSEPASDMDKFDEIDCATYLELSILSWVEQQMADNQHHSEAHGTISDDDKGFSIDFDVVVKRKIISDNQDTMNKDRESYIHMISGFHKKVWATQFY